MRGASLFTVTAHYASGACRTFPNLPRSEALSRMRGALTQDGAATFTVEGPHPAPARLKGIWH